MKRRRVPKAGPIDYRGAFAVALIVGVAISQTAFGQAPAVAVNVIAMPGEDSAIETGPPPGCSASLCKSIERYKNKGLVGITEFQTNYPTCTFIDSGKWTPGINIEPTDKGTPAGAVDVSQPPFTGSTPPGCDGTGGPYLYAPIYFKWNLHKNLTALPGWGPLATFYSNWYTKDGRYNEPWSFQITVPTVRPKGETTVFTGFVGPLGSTGNFGAYGRWKMTLKPPNDDPSFDFTGETIREEFQDSQDTCAGRAPDIVPPSSGTPSGTPATWKVGELQDAGGATKPAGKNEWGYDFTGFDACTVFAYRCAGVTAPPCGIRLTQGIKIKSPADQGYTFPLYSNNLGESIGGVSHPGTIKWGDGPVTVKRVSPTTGTGGELPFNYVSNELLCSRRPLVLQNLRNHPGSCLAPRR